MNWIYLNFSVFPASDIDFPNVATSFCISTVYSSLGWSLNHWKTSGLTSSFVWNFIDVYTIQALLYMLWSFLQTHMTVSNKCWWVLNLLSPEISSTHAGVKGPMLLGIIKFGGKELTIVNSTTSCQTYTVQFSNKT